MSRPCMIAGCQICAMARTTWLVVLLGWLCSKVAPPEEALPR